MRALSVAPCLAVWDRSCRMAAPHSFNSTRAAFFAGVKSAWTSVFFLVLAGTYIGMGAIAHDFGFASWWLALSTVLVWAAPAQVILISALGGGASLFEAAIAVTLSAIRLFPMVVALLPLLRGQRTRLRDLLLPTHFTSVSMWVESLRLLPGIARERRHRLLQRPVVWLYGRRPWPSASSAFISPPDCRRCLPARCCF